MSERARIGLDNPVFSGRLRQPFSDALPVTKKQSEDKFLTDYIHHGQQVKEQAIKSAPSNIAAVVTAWATGARRPAHDAAVPFSKLEMEPIQEPLENRAPAGAHNRLPEAFINVRAQMQLFLGQFSRLQLAAFGIALLVFLVGVAVSLQTMQSNRNAEAQLETLSQQVNQSAGNALKNTGPIIVKPQSGQPH